MKELQLNKPETTTVPAIDPWFATGFMLRKGSTYQFEVIPKEQVWRDGKTLGDFTADGKMLPWLSLMYLFIRMPSVKWFALLGCVNKKRSTYFKIGVKPPPYTATEDGELFCFANDALGFNGYFYKHNNCGEITVTIIKIG